MKQCLINNLNKDCHFHLQGSEYLKGCIKKTISASFSFDNEDYTIGQIIKCVINAQFSSQSLVEVYKYKTSSTNIMPKLHELLLNPEYHLKEYIISTHEYLNHDATNNATVFEVCINKLLKELAPILLNFDQMFATKKVERCNFISRIINIYEGNASSRQQFATICRFVCDIPQELDLSVMNSDEDHTTIEHVD
jgi:hypothetical protein